MIYYVEHHRQDYSVETKFILVQAQKTHKRHTKNNLFFNNTVGFPEEAKSNTHICVILRNTLRVTLFSRFVYFF